MWVLDQIPYSKVRRVGGYLTAGNGQIRENSDQVYSWNSISVTCVINNLGIRGNNWDGQGLTSLIEELLTDNNNKY